MLCFIGRTAVAFALVLGSLQSAGAVIKKLMPLKEVIGDATMILVAEVGKVDADKPSVIFQFKENLKGKAGADSFPVNLKGDAFAKKDGHSKAMIERLSPGRKLILFVTQVEKTSVGFGFLEGTWFQIRGTTGDDGKTVTWAFLHCEPFFRRTFKGTTDELKAVVEKAVSGKAAPPDANEKEEPGLGPVPEKKGAANRSPMLLGVIPSAVLIAPLAVVAALFPGVFARLAIAMKQWRAFLAISSINTTLAAAYYFLREFLPDRWIFSPQAFLVLLVGITFAGMLWAGRRYRRLGSDDASITMPPSKQNLLSTFGFMAAIVAFLLLAAWLFVGRAGLIELPTREFTGIAAGLSLALLYGLYRTATQSLDGAAKTKLSLSGEAVALAGTMLFTVSVLATSIKTPAAVSTGSELGDAVESAIGPKLADIRTMTFPGAVEVMSGLALDSNGRLYFGAEGKGGTGSVWCADPSTGDSIWKFTNGGDLQPVYCIPTIADGKVFVGEGLHTDSDRRMFCLDAKTGTAIGYFKTESHTEGRPALVGNKLVFSAGDDGVFCIDANDRKQFWHFEGLKQKLHVDTPPAVRGRRVFFGSGYNTLALLCVDINTGDELWRTPVDLRSFGAPLARGSHVYYGLGTGNLIEDLSVEPEDAAVPRESVAKGAIVCLAAETGKQVWRYDLPKSVHSEMAADLRTVYACCKDGTVYAIDRASGNLRWKRAVGPTFASGPALATYANGAATLAVYAVTIDGRATCLNPVNGEAFWIRDLGEHSQKLLQVISTPVVMSSEGKRTLFVGSKAENKNNGERVATIFRIEDVIED